ncbi:YicC/YloC family endoribonuclease [Paenibacillus apiarius]|uniref:YicC family protein n=1 Tax=Paenibacillus apiarius TaxID=46240 RepID=A0ABT4DLK9_9BACL|nr:YicC/YloC family endoribonuclease [Paenibacillus apiarius]MCY9513690.1 YicC family protein [Paenibacillus apiarius]MCY9518241.1 YicC family protein [Paenibacillus apiarius]MCY9551358.1 YicC family protein [Paenibacillus apiarius]MCY9558512.1 YicC family protein [Paenibacillus apiarius]MCY9684174.1 YicC family protein [Paenibacillus apiarius]
MVYSMTGYGQSAREIGGYKISIEVKSVNHRYCEIMLRMPREWTSHEDRLRRIVQQHVKRGRIDVFINKEREGEAKTLVEINDQTLEAYMQASQLLRDKYGVSGELSVDDWLRLPDIITIREETSWSEEELTSCLESGLTEAMDGLCRMRAMEGSHLNRDLAERLGRLQSLHAEMMEWAPVVVTEYRAKLKQRIEQLLDANSSFDDHKFGMEVALFAERSNIDEELTRLKSHFGQFGQLLHSGEPIGRKLDFLIQEMNRETNTIGSKANHLELVNRVVDMKAELEKIREQAANIE